MAQEHGQGWPISNVDTKQIVQDYGRDVLMIGNLPCIDVILNQSPDEVYKASYADAVAGAAGGRYVLSSDCDVSPLTSDENIAAMVRAAKDAEHTLFGAASA